jgi:hypothetical protein
MPNERVVMAMANRLETGLAARTGAVDRCHRTAHRGTCPTSCSARTPSVCRCTRARASPSCSAKPATVPGRRGAAQPHPADAPPDHCRVDLVGMESTGVYWKPVFFLLEEHVPQVWLLNAEHLRNVPGRKTDVADSAWIAQLVEHGLVAPSFVPPAPIPGAA